MICPTYKQFMQQTTLKKDPCAGISHMIGIIIYNNNNNNNNNNNAIMIIIAITIFITLFQCLRDLAPAEDIRNPSDLKKYHLNYLY